VLRVREKPPLGLYWLVTAPEGNQFRWGDDDPNVERVPQGATFSSTMPGGYETHDAQLLRSASGQYPDLTELSNIEVSLVSGTTVWDGRLERMPRQSGAQMAATVGAVGHQAHLEDDKSAKEIYVDRDLTRWTSMSLQRRLNLAASSPGYGVFDPSVEPDVTTGEPALKTMVRGAWANRVACSALYDANRVPIGSIYYAWKRGAGVSTGGTVWTWSVRASDVDTFVSGVDATGDLEAAGPGSGTLSTTATTRVFGEAVLAFEGAGGAEAFEYVVAWTALAVFGNHGLTKRGIAPNEGFYASDIVQHAVARWAPQLDVYAVEQSGFVIPHAVFLEPTTAGEMLRQATRFGLQDWGVWEKRRLYWGNPGTYGRRWQSPVSPAQLQEAGPQIERLWNSVVVQYQDVSGAAKTVGPPGALVDATDAVLADSDPENPVTRAGLVRRALLQMGTSTAAGAIEVGRRFLQEQKALSTAGQATLVGFVQDADQIWHSVAEVRAGDFIRFTDASDTGYRKIVRANYSHTDRSCSLDLDSPPEGLQALLERLNVVLVPLGV
jgi:hypothetical protein